MKTPVWPLLLALALLPTLPAWAGVETFYVGTYTGATGSQGIYVGTLDTDTGRLGPLRLAAAVEKDPTFLALSPDHRFLFAALSDGVASFAIRPDGTLNAINRQPTGPNICHVSLGRAGRELFAAGYDAGTVSAFPVAADGTIGPRTAFIALHGSGPNPDRQTGPHIHSVYADPENRFLYACDLGSDRIWIFRLAAHDRLTPANPPATIVAPGLGPRHLAFSPDGRQVYVANELGVSTSTFRRNPTTGTLTLLDTEDNIPPGWPKGTGSGEIVMHPSGRWLVVSTRVEDMITVFAIHHGFVPGPPLQRQQIVISPAKFPRSIALDPSGHWLLVAGQLDNSIAVMKIDPTSGQLTPTSECQSVGSPVCILFAPVPR